jgi:hypothetical protein
MLACIEVIVSKNSFGVEPGDDSCPFSATVFYPAICCIDSLSGPILASVLCGPLERTIVRKGTIS